MNFWEIRYMKYYQFIVTLLLLTGFVITKFFAQEAVLPSGGTSSGIGGTTTYSVGQVVYNIDTGFNGSVTQGVQQPYEISKPIVGLEETKGIVLNCIVFPNPTTDLLTIIIENHPDQSFRYQFCDSYGHMLSNGKVDGQRKTISTTSFPPAIYFLKVMNRKMGVKIIKVIKN